MRCVVSCVLTAVTALVICTVAEPKAVVSAARIAYPLPPLPPERSQRLPPEAEREGGSGPLSDVDTFFSPYDLLDVVGPVYEKTASSRYDYDPKVLWIAKEIEQLNRQREQERLENIKNLLVNYDTDEKPQDFHNYNPNEFAEVSYDYQILPEYAEDKVSTNNDENEINKTKDIPEHINKSSNEQNNMFAYTPQEKEFFEPNASEEPVVADKNENHLMSRRGDETPPKARSGFEDIRQTRQNPNKVKTVAEDHQENKHPSRAESLGRLSAAASGRGGDVSQKHLVSDYDEEDFSLYTIAVFTAVGAALSVAIIGIAFGWYNLSKKAKAAADVDYPAYGVTGPCGESLVDSRLAQSAHMYHYQHQKQQIIAMERAGADDRNGSSDADSDDDNEEGDYTVYECPGFASTGDMEVKNPMFSDDPTPVTPGAAGSTEPSPIIIVDHDDN